MTPGDLITFLATVNGWRRRRLYLSTLPPSEQRRIKPALDALQGYLEDDVHAGGALVDAMQRLRDAFGRGTVASVQVHDLTRLQRFLTQVPTTRRPSDLGAR